MFSILPTEIVSIILLINDNGTKWISRMVCKQWKFILNELYLQSEQVLPFFAGEGNLKLLWYFFGEGSRWNEKICSSAVKYGHIHILKFIVHRNLAHEDFAHLLLSACKNGHFDIVQWIYVNNFYHRTPDDFTRVAARCGNIDIIAFFYERKRNGYGYDQKHHSYYYPHEKHYLLYQSSMRGYLHILIWALQKFNIFEALQSNNSYYEDHNKIQPIRKYMNKNHINYCDDIFFIAAIYEQKHIIKWGINNEFIDLQKRNDIVAILEYSKVTDFLS